MLHNPELLRMMERAARRQVDIEVLQTRVWLAQILLDLQLTAHQLADKCHSEKHACRTAVFRWFAGQSAANSNSVRRVSRLVKGSDAIHALPLWDLLRPAPLKLSTVECALNRFRCWDGPQPWQFPGDAEPSGGFSAWSAVGRNDVDALASRGDQYGLTILVGLVREAECLEEPQLHIYRSIGMVRALPSLLAKPAWRKHAKMLCTAVDHLIKRSSLTEDHVAVDWASIERIADDASVKHPIDWRIRAKSVVDPVEYQPISLPPPSPWATWLSTASEEHKHWAGFKTA